MLSKRRATSPNDAVLQPEAASRPTLRSISPEFAALADRWAELTEQETALLERLRPLVRAATKAGAYEASGLIPSPPKPPEPADYKPGVRERIADLIPFKKPDQPRPSESTKLRVEAEQIAAQLGDIRVAKEILQPELRRATFAASVALCDAVRPKFTGIARNIVDALVSLGAALSTQNAFIRELEQQGASTATLRRVGLTIDGSDPLPIIGRALRLAVEASYVDAIEIEPEILRR